MMEAIAQAITNWTGSSKTEELVRQQVRQRWGDEEADNFSAKFSARPLHSWSKLGFRVKRGEKALCSFVLIEKKDTDGKVIKRSFKPICLFHVRQVELAKR